MKRTLSILTLVVISTLAFASKAGEKGRVIKVMPESRLSTQDSVVDTISTNKDKPSEINNKTDVVPIKISTVTKGTFKGNMERLAKEQGFYPVIWDKRVKSCVWDQIQGYPIPKKEPREIIAFYADTLDFKPIFSDVDKHVQLIYFGPKTRIQNCEN